MPGAASAGIAAALSAALLYGMVNVVGKFALASVTPLLLAALSYAAAGLFLVPLARGARFAREDYPRLAVMILAGAVGAPLLFFHGLALTTAVTAGLLLNLEMLFTTLLAVMLLGERVRFAGALALGALALGAVLVSAVAPFVAGEGEGASSSLGAFLVALAALGWAVDNTASTPLAKRYDPRHLIALKGLAGGFILLGSIALLRLPLVPPRESWLALAFIGVLGVGVSSVLFYWGLRKIGAARTATLFSTVGLFGAVGAHFLLGEAILWPHLVGAVLMIAGVAVLSRE